MSYNSSIPPSTIARQTRGIKLDVGFRVNSKLHCTGGVEICSHEGCEIYGIVKDNDQLLCFYHYRDKQNHPEEISIPGRKSLLKRRPLPGSVEY